MMKNLKIIFSCLLKDFDSDDSLEGLIYAIRDLINIVSNEQVLAALPKNERHLNRQFPVDTYNKYRKTTA